MNQAEQAMSDRIDRIADSQEKLIQAIAVVVESTPCAASKALMAADKLSAEMKRNAAKLAAKTEVTAAQLAAMAQKTAAEMARIANTQSKLIESVEALVDATAAAASKVLRAAELFDAKTSGKPVSKR